MKNQQHESRQEVRKDSPVLGTHEEMHEGLHGAIETIGVAQFAKFYHYHVELVGSDREKPFTDDELKVLMKIVEGFVWPVVKQRVIR